MDNKQVIITIGIPASGKSAWAKELIKSEKGRWKRINKDDLREMLDCSQWSGDNEKFVLKTRDTLILNALDAGFNVIVDDTNIHQKHEVRIRQIAGKKADVSIKVFDTPLDECIVRDYDREKSVGEKVIRTMHEQFVKRFGSGTCIDEKKSFVKKDRTRDLSLNPAFNRNSDLPDAIICDLDGTLALMNGRNPYDASTCDQDLLNIPIASIVRKFRSQVYDDEGSNDYVRVILCSGREEKYRDPTLKFLEKYDIRFDELHMRPTGDKRKDSVVKREIYDNNIENNYNVLFCLDDRDQIVSMWRNELNLTCLQVDYGDF